MIVGLGIDLVELDRIRHSLERFGGHFTGKLLHASEAAFLDGAVTPYTAIQVARVAARFAAKEAGAKALGSGFSGGIGLHDIRICSLPSGQPHIVFHGKALERARTMGVTGAHLSLTHSRDNACAVVVLDSVPGEPPLQAAPDVSGPEDSQGDRL